VLALKQQSGSPPTARNAFVDAAAGEGGEAEEARASAPPCSGSACASRYRSDFKQLRPLGKGAFSCVFEVVGRLDGVRYAVKRSARELRSAPERRAAQAEAQALAAAGGHPWLVRYHCAWWEESRLHIQLELCGGSLGGRAAAGPPMPPPELALMLRCVASALAHLHAAGVAHMDVKPDNIFAAAPGPPGGPACGFKLGDLGAASPLRRRADSPGVLEGDAVYLPPELLSGCLGALDRADVWSLAASAYELARAQPLPREGGEYRALRRGEMQALPPAFPEELQRLLQRCLRPYPSQRPPAAQLAAASALAALLADAQPPQTAA